MVCGFSDRLYLKLCRLDRSKVALGLRRQLTCVQLTIFLKFLLVLNETPLGVLELRLQKDIRALGKILTVTAVFVDEQRRQTSRDFLREDGILVHVGPL